MGAVLQKGQARDSEPLTVTNILCIHITVFEYILIKLYCCICSPQNQIIGEQGLSLTDADDLLPLYGKNSPAENNGHDALK